MTNKALLQGYPVSRLSAELEGAAVYAETWAHGLHLTESWGQHEPGGVGTSCGSDSRLQPLQPGEVLVSLRIGTYNYTLTFGDHNATVFL